MGGGGLIFGWAYIWGSYIWNEVSVGTCGGLIHGRVGLYMGGGGLLYMWGAYIRGGGLIVEGLRYLFNIYFIVTIMQWANVVIKHI